MGKYNVDRNAVEKYTWEFIRIANELAEANRLKRLELSWAHADPRTLKELEDKA